MKAWNEHDLLQREVKCLIPSHPSGRWEDRDCPLGIPLTVLGLRDWKSSRWGHLLGDPRSWPMGTLSMTGNAWIWKASTKNQCVWETVDPEAAVLHPQVSSASEKYYTGPFSSLGIHRQKEEDTLDLQHEEVTSTDHEESTQMMQGMLSRGGSGLGLTKQENEISDRAESRDLHLGFCQWCQRNYSLAC